MRLYPDQFRRSGKVKEVTILGLDCILRLSQTMDLTRRIKRGKPTGLATLAIIGVDIGDGMAARRGGVDGPKRRVLDSVLDSAIITSALTATYRKRPAARPYIAMLAAREVFVASGWATDLLKTRQVKKGDVFHKLPSLAIAAFGVAANRDNKKVMKAAGWTAVGINMALAIDYYKGWAQPEHNVVLDNGVEEVPGFSVPRRAIGKFMAARNSQLETGSQSIALETPRDFIDGSCIEIAEAS